MLMSSPQRSRPAHLTTSRCILPASRIVLGGAGNSLSRSKAYMFKRHSFKRRQTTVIRIYTVVLYSRRIDKKVIFHRVAKIDLKGAAMCNLPHGCSRNKKICRRSAALPLNAVLFGATYTIASQCRVIGKTNLSHDGLNTSTSPIVGWTKTSSCYYIRRPLYCVGPYKHLARVPRCGPAGLYT